MHGPELEYIAQAYHTNWMSTVGENIRVIEEDIPPLAGCGHGVALSCGTAALHLALKLAGVQPGEKVFCSDMTFAATANPILYEKAIPVFIDSEYETWNMDPDALEQAFRIYPDVRIVVIADLYGVPAKYDEIQAVCRRHNAILIEDAAESFGAVYQGLPAGSLGNYNIISFNGNKIITGSSGGMLLTHDAESAQKARKWSTQSRENAPWYQHEEIGYNYRMSNVIAGVVRGQLPYLKNHIDRKKEIYLRYREGFRDLPVMMNPFPADLMEPNYWLSCMLIDEQAMCDQIRSGTEVTFRKVSGKTCPTEILEALDSCNAEGRPIWKPLHMQPLHGRYEFVTTRKNRHGACGDIFHRGLCLPSDIKMTPEIQDQIIEIIKSCF